MKPRRPWLAALANLIASPVGYVYVGAPIRGAVLWTGLMALGLGGVHLLVRSTSVLWLVLTVALVGLNLVVLPLDAAVLARRARSYRPKAYNRWYAYLAVAIVAWLGGELWASGVRGSVAEAFSIPSGAMVPTLLVGDHLLVDKSAYRTEAPQRLDVVVFDYPPDPTQRYVKRIIGLPGDVVEVHGKRVRVNDREIDEPYVQHTHGGRTSIGPVGPLTVPEGEYFVLGDNRDRSSDSRHWGPVPRSMILGRVHVVYWSWDGQHGAVRWDRIGRVVGR